MRNQFILWAWLALVAAVSGQEFHNIEYLCCDWGPAMKMSSSTNAAPQFSQTEEEIYFLKQVGSFTRKKLAKVDPTTGSDVQEEGRGINIYLCKMKPDGSEKTKIKELWRNVTHPIDTQGQSTWMDVHEKTGRIALAIRYAGSDLTGLWVMNLDGSELKRIITPEQNERHLQAINHPSWTPDGQWIVFEEEFRGANPNRFNITRCDVSGANVKRLLAGGSKEQYMRPSVSPDGGLIMFVKYPDGYPGQRWLWLMDIDGTNVRPVGGKQTLSTWGDWPAWSPDGGRILVRSKIIVTETGKELLARVPSRDGQARSYGWPQWGRAGVVGYNLSGILFTDADLKSSRLLGESRVVECVKGDTSCEW